MKKIQILLIALFSTYIVPLKAQDLQLWYDKPATDWMTEALPIGNGYMGSMFFGTVTAERIQFSEGGLWSGGPNSNKDYNFGLRPNAWKHLVEVRNLLSQGKFDEADELIKDNLAGIVHPKAGKEYGDFGAQQTMGDLYVKVNAEGLIKNYKRSLNLDNGTANVSYERNGINFKRTYFGNYPNKIMVYQFENSKPINYELSLKTPHPIASLAFEKNTLKLKGHVADNQQAFETDFHILTDGKIQFKDSLVYIKNATYVTLKHTAATAYLNKFPDYTGNKFEEIVTKTIDKTKNISYKKLLASSIKDYQSLFNRVKLQLKNGISYAQVPTDKRISAYHQHPEDKDLIVLLYQYGRYLMISASRPGTQPMSLQGRWNNSTNPPWANDYHMNINQQMLYWPAEVTNLAECHEPFLDYIPTLLKPGNLTAKDFFNTRGWVVNTMNNAFGYTSPGWGLPWGFFPGGAAWISQHLWQHYQFTQNETFLKEKAYPVMKEAALFWVDYLSKNKEGYLVSSPSYSPEHGTISDGSTMDHEIAWEIFESCINASQVLNKDHAFRDTLIAMQKQILPLKIGKWGQLQEWNQDLDDPKDTHRHISHLYALYPSAQIDPEKKPELAKAAETSLLARGDGGTGWSLAWKINFWARLQNGEKAHQIITNFITLVGSDLNPQYSGGGVYSNLLCAHPPFQLDGNMGTTAGISEMLLQSIHDKIALLPALPADWDAGSIIGLKARGGYEVSINWNEGQVQTAFIKAAKNGTCTIESKVALKLKGSQTISSKVNQKYFIKINVLKGKTYELIKAS